MHIFALGLIYNKQIRRIVVPGNKFDLEIGERSRSQSSCIPNIQCSITNTSEDTNQVKVFVTDRQRDRRMSLNVPAFTKGGGLLWN